MEPSNKEREKHLANSNQMRPGELRITERSNYGEYFILQLKIVKIFMSNRGTGKDANTETDSET